MPELPDVERFRRLLDAEGLNRRIADVTVHEPRILYAVTPRQLRARLTGATLTETRRHGKHLLACCSLGGWLTLHFGMTGAIAVLPPGAALPPYTRVDLRFDDGGCLACTDRRMLGRVGLADDAEAFFRDQKLGSDALDPRLDRKTFAARLAGVRRGVKAALMDQSLVAGIGNIYSDEILFQAGLHPETRIDSLDAAALGRLYRAMRRVLGVAVARGAGSEEFLDRLPRGYLLPRRNEGGECPRCGGPLTSFRSGGRRGWFCPRCQPAPRRGH